MNDTVTKLLELVDRYAIAYGWSGDNGVRTIDARKALQDELVRLFTPLTDDAVTTGYCFQPHRVQYIAVFMSGVRWAEREHGITARKQRDDI